MPCTARHRATVSHGHPLLSLSLGVALAIPLLSLAGCHAKPKETVQTEQNVDPNQVTLTPELATSMKLGSPAMAEVAGTLELPAHVETDARQIARVGSPVSGRILRLLAFEGEHVRPGRVLAMLHSTDLSDAQLALVKAVSQRSLAEASARRAEALISADVIGRAELERRNAELLQANSEVASYRTQLRGLGMTEQQIRQVETTHALSADYPIVAPKGGTVLKREVTIGQVVQPADPAFTIADLSSVWIVANVPEEEAGRMRRSMEVAVTVPALLQQQIKGRLSFVSPIVDPATRTVEVRMEVANREGLLKPDQLASMTFLGHTEKKLTVPSTAVVREDNKDFVFVQSSTQTFTLHEVQLGDEVQPGHGEQDRRVVQSGLTGGERIVTDGAFHLNNQRKQNAIKGGE